MKSEEFVMQELEKDRCMNEGNQPDEKPLTKFMISAEAPLVMSKACELLIRELSVRAWQHTAKCRRRTLQRQDIHSAVCDSDVFDFLIDLVPRVASHRMPASNAIPVDMAHMGQTILMQNHMRTPASHLNMNMPGSMLAQSNPAVPISMLPPGNATSGYGQVEMRLPVDQPQHLNHELMLAFAQHAPSHSGNLEDNNGQQLFLQQHAAAFAQDAAQQSEQAPIQWKGT
jgi:histone H3/H4